MLYLGLDVHSKWTRIEGFNPENGETVSLPKVANEPDSIREALEGLDGPLHGVMEIGTNAWAMYYILNESFERLVVVDALRTWGTEGRRGAKTDKRDAMKLAEKLYHGQLVPLYVPDNVTQDYRCLIRARVSATRKVTEHVNEIGSLLRSWGVILECSLLTKKGQELIEKSRERLGENSLLVLDAFLEQFASAKEMEEKLTKKIEAVAKEDETCQLLMTIPGVGSMTALAVRAEVGDIRRFPSAKHLISYCGLGPQVSQSAEKLRYGALPKACNKILRYMLVLRASGAAAAKTDNPIRRAYLRVAFRGHVNDGKISAARKLTRIIYAMMKHGEPWDPLRAAARSR